MTRTGIENGAKGKDLGSKGTMEESSNNGTLSTRKLQDYPENQEQHNVDIYEEMRDHVVKKRRADESTECLFDRLPTAILHEILCRLSIMQLCVAARTCVAWSRTVWSCKVFQKMYDQRNKESWIVRCKPSPRNIEGLLFLNINSKRWSLLPTKTQGKLCLLQGHADGLMLFLSDAGKLGVANPLTAKVRVLPDTQVTSRLTLHECLKKRVWSCRTATPHIHLSLQTVVDTADQKKTFKVMVWGELRTRQIHLLVYSSATDTWSTKLCPDVDYRLFKSPVFFSVDGHTIYVTSPYQSPSVVASYNTDTGAFVVNRPRSLQFREEFHPRAVERVHTIGIIAYKSQILLLAVMAVEFRGFPTPLVGLWQGNPTGGQWQLFSGRRLIYPYLLDIVAAYDGNSSVTIIQGMRLVLTLNLDTKEWKKSSLNPTSSGTTGGLDFRWAYHMKLRFSTASQPYKAIDFNIIM